MSVGRFRGWRARNPALATGEKNGTPEDIEALLRRWAAIFKQPPSRERDSILAALVDVIVELEMRAVEEK